MTKGFTLIELLIVIAIIGVLAGTVIVSLGSQTNKASEGVVKQGVSTLRTAATVEALNFKKGDPAAKVCDELYDKVSGEKDGWHWDGSRHCRGGALISTSGFTAAGATPRAAGIAAAKAGEICCHSQNEKWVLWGALPDADGRRKNNATANNEDIYCADHKGFLGELEVLEANGSTAVKQPKAPDSSSIRCK